MSTAQLSHHNSVSTKRMTSRVHDVPKRAHRPQRTKITQIYQYDNKGIITEEHRSSIKNSPVDTTAMSIEMLNQYNDIIGTEDSLAFKTLPPVKVSYHSTKNKFMESARGESSSRVIRPHLSVKTHSPGHHIFTEGISKNSIVRSPTFALQKVGVPYSNLPDNISIHKEKDKFAFGVKREEYEKSPYRLTPKPFKTGSATFITKIDCDKSSNVSNEKFLKSRAGGTRVNTKRHSLEVKSNVIRLQPLVNMDKDGKPDFCPEFIKVPAVPLSPSKPPLAPRNSIHGIDTDEMKITVQIGTNKKLQSKADKSGPPRDRKLSVVSIGETMDPNFYGNTKKETRQLYPMYDHKSRMNENYRRQMFEYSGHDSIHSRPNVPPATFTYKVSSRSLSFIQDTSPGRVVPIKNNLRDSQGNLIHKQRGYRMTSSLDDVSKFNSDYNFRKYYRRVFRRPNSTETLSTDISLVPGNPPPSEISHIFSEDAPIVINDLRKNEMLTLVEERTMTASIMSPRKTNTPHNMLNRVGNLETPPNTKHEDRNEGMVTNRSQRTYLEEIETCTDTEIQFGRVFQAADGTNRVETRMSQNLSSLDTGRIPNPGTDSSRSPLESNSLKKTTENKEKDKINHVDALSSLEPDQNDEVVKSSKSVTSLNETSANNENSVLEYIAEGEMRVKEHTLSANSDRTEEGLATDKSKTDTLDTIGEQQTATQDDKKISLPKIKGAKSLMTVPKLSLDSSAHHPALDAHKERTSLSRSLQSLTCAENKPSESSYLYNENYSLKLDIEKSGEVTLRRTHVPVTRLRLFSETSSMSAGDNDALYESLGIQMNIGASSRSPEQQMSEKKLINNANVPFIYPSTSEIKAKRQ